MSSLLGKGDRFSSRVKYSMQTTRLCQIIIAINCMLFPTSDNERLVPALGRRPEMELAGGIHSLPGTKSTYVVGGQSVRFSDDRMAPPGLLSRHAERANA